MKTAAVASAPTLDLARSRLADYLEFAKPRIAVMVLFTVAIGYWLASPDGVVWWQLLHTLIGTALVAAGASALNQLMEKDSDALMRRTQRRPLPAGRLQPVEVLTIGAFFSLGGLCYLALMVRQPLCVLVAALTLILYVWVYTPLKRKTTLNTLIGAVPGALPPLIGWTAAQDSISVEGGVLFLLLFCWQVPHFLAIAWIYRAEYERAGLCMLPVVDRTGQMTGRQMLLYAIALVAVSLLPLVHGHASWGYCLGALTLGALFLASIVRFMRVPGTPRARSVLRLSLLYLPGMFALLLL